MITITDVLITVIFLLLLTVPGLLFAKLKILPEKAGEMLSVIVLYCCQPIMNIVCFQGCSLTKKIAVNMLWVAGLAIVVHGLLFLLLTIIFAKKSREEKLGIVKYASVFSNCGFMGVPFLQSLFPDSEIQAEVLVYCAVVLAIFNILNWTVGVYFITGDKKQISLKKVLLNPVIISVFVGLLLFLILQKPIVEFAVAGSLWGKVLEKLMKSLHYISDMITPLSMFMVGTKLANIDLKYIFKNGYIFFVSAIKLILMPLLTIAIIALLPISSVVKYTLFFVLAMPSASSGAMMAVKYGKDGDFASACILMSTILCVLTIPLTYLLMSLTVGL